jgi:predicted DNA-binding transcriptional regulator YafY
MAVRHHLNRLFLIYKKIREGNATFEDIDDFLSRNSDEPRISKRTFQRDIQEINDIFNITIKFDFSRKVYFIDDEQEKPNFNSILESLDQLSLINLSERIPKHIQFEQRKSKGTDYLMKLACAIQDKEEIEFTYENYWLENQGRKKVEPCLLKEFRYRWYLIGKSLSSNEIRTYALDRISDLKVTGYKFKPNKEFNPNEFFKHSFGIYGSNNPNPEEVVLSFTPEQGNYIKNLPLHHSQQIIKDDEDELRIKLHVMITFDFIIELLSYREAITVIKPKSLIKTMKEIYTKALANYKQGALN